MIVTLIILLVILLVLSAVLSGSETALFSLSSIKVKLFKGSQSKPKRLVSKLLENPRDLLVTILMINVAMNLGVQNVTSSLFGTFSGWELTVGVPLALTLIFGEVIPKSIAITRGDQIAPKVSGIIYLIRSVLGPLRWLFTKLASQISRAIFFFLRKEKEISIDELKHALETTKEQGGLTEDEAKLIRGTLKIEEVLVKELMCPRQDILFYDIKSPIQDLVSLFVEEQVARIPVIQNDDLDQVVGIISSDLFFLYKDKIYEGSDLITVLKEPFYVPESASARNLLAQFHQLGESLALVVDEYGQTSGLITREDIVEIVIGQIEDKRDEETLFTKQSDDIIICSGQLELSELEEIFNISLDLQSSTATVAGLLIELTGDIPKSGTKHVMNNLLFHVLSATPQKVLKVYIRRLNPPKKRRSHV